MLDDAPDRNLALDLVRVTEAAALSAARHMGRGDPAAAADAAARAMVHMLQSVEADGVLAIRCGLEDDSGLAIGMRLGSGNGQEWDVALNPVDGARLLAHGRANATSIVALASRGSLFDAGPVRYVHKIAVSAASASAIDLGASAERNLWSIARALRKDVDDLTVVVLDRPRHAELISQIRSTGARIRLITDGDVAGALMAATPQSGIDVLMGIGGAAEAVVAACALKCLGGAMQCQLAPTTDEERAAAIAQGLDPSEILTLDRLVAAEDCFVAATGITDGELLRGVTYHGAGARTHSLSMRSRSGTIRWIDASHHWEKLMRISQLPYDTLTRVNS